MRVAVALSTGDSLVQVNESSSRTTARNVMAELSLKEATPRKGRSNLVDLMN